MVNESGPPEPESTGGADVSPGVDSTDREGCDSAADRDYGTLGSEDSRHPVGEDEPSMQSSADSDSSMLGATDAEDVSDDCVEEVDDEAPRSRVGKGFNPGEDEHSDLEEGNTDEGLIRLDPLPARPSNCPPVAEARASRIAQQIPDTRVVLLASRDQDVLRSAMYTVVDAQPLGSTDRRWHLMTPIEVGDDDLIIDGLLNRVAAGRATSPSTIAVSIDTSCAARALGPFSNPIYTDSLRARLAERNLFLVLCLQHVGDSIPSHITNARCKTWVVDAIDTVLEQQFGPAWHAVRTQLEEQAAAGQWPPLTTGLCYDKLRHHLKRGTLDEVLADPTSAAGTVGRAAFSTPLHRTACFVAVHLQDLPLEDFEAVLFTLLGETARGDDDGTTRLLREVWRDTYDQVMDDCSLVFARRCVLGLPGLSGEAPDVICVIFDPPERVLEAQGELSLRYASDQADLARRAQECHLVLADSPVLRDRAIDLLLAMARIRPDLYGHAWLMNLVALGGSVERIVDAENARLHRIERSDRKAIYARLRLIIERMAEEGRFTDVITGLLSGLMKRRDFDAVLDIISGLRWSAEIDILHWSKRLLDEGPVEIPVTVTHQLSRLARSYDQAGEAPRFLTTLAAWLPGPRRLSNSGRTAIELFTEMVERSMSEPHRGTVGRWPPDNRLLRAFDASFAETLARWFLHRDVEDRLAELLPRHRFGLGLWLRPKALRTSLPDGGREAAVASSRFWRRMASREPLHGRQVFAAFAVVDWWVVVGGHGSDTRTEAVEFRNCLLRALVDLADAEQWRRLIASWRMIDACLAATLDACARVRIPPTRDRRRRLKGLIGRMKGRRRRTRDLLRSARRLDR